MPSTLRGRAWNSYILVQASRSPNQGPATTATLFSPFLQFRPIKKSDTYGPVVVRNFSYNMRELNFFQSSSNFAIWNILCSKLFFFGQIQSIVLLLVPSLAWGESDVRTTMWTISPVRCGGSMWKHKDTILPVFGHLIRVNNPDYWTQNRKFRWAKKSFEIIKS